jgi:hypothetical protein
MLLVEQIEQHPSKVPYKGEPLYCAIGGVACLSKMDGAKKTGLIKVLGAR